MKYTPEIIKDLKSNQVFVFGSNMSGFHGAGASGFACRGVTNYNWRGDKWFVDALKSPKNSEKRKGKWAVVGVAKGYQEGREGSSYAIITIKKPGLKRSVSLKFIESQIIELCKFANKNPNKEFLVTKIGSKLAGWTIEEIKLLFLNCKDIIPNNIILPREYEFRS